MRDRMNSPHARIVVGLVVDLHFWATASWSCLKIVIAVVAILVRISPLGVIPNEREINPLQSLVSRGQLVGRQSYSPYSWENHYVIGGSTETGKFFD